MGNLGSVKRKLDRINAEAIITSNADEIISCEKFILPGVGHFGTAVAEIRSRGLWELLNEQVIIEKKPILGICLGMQLMAKHSEEGNIEGFGWFDAEVVHFSVKDKLKHKVPHMGWNRVTVEKESSLFDNVDLETGFYFVHSYHLKCNDRKDVLNITEYDYSFVSAVQKDNIYGVQYHPEKSHDAGEQLLRNFVKLGL